MEKDIMGSRYEILEHIGGGGMADVYRAHDRLLDRTVAVKILHAQLAGDEEFLDKFRHEAKGAARLSHPNIVGIYDVGVDGNDHYIVMEYVPGETLKKRIQMEGGLGVREALRIAREIAGALSHAHANNLVHCDIKPHNILVTPEGRVKVADFGIARAITSSTVTYNGNIVGSVHYFSPEQAKGTKITPKSDVYSLGVVMYEMMTGKLPFTGETPVSIALKHLSEEPVPIRSIDEEIPPAAEAIVQKAMAKNPAERPDSHELIEEISQTEKLLGFSEGYSDGKPDPFATQLISRGEVTEEAGRRKKPTPPFYRTKTFMLLTAFILFAGFVAGAFISFGKFWSTEEISVPDVVGKQMALSKEILEAAKLRVTVTEEYSADVPAGAVIAQSPDGGARVKEQRVVTLRISKGGEALTMPDIKGLSRLAAEERIKKMGLSIGSVFEKVSEQEAWTVLDQDPSPGAKIVQGKRVDITLSKGHPIRLARVPDFTGGALENARTRLAQLRLKIGSVTKEESRQAEGTILAQTPSGGSDVEEGTAIDFVVAEKAKEAQNPPATVTPEAKKPDTPKATTPAAQPAPTPAPASPTGPSRTNVTGKT